MSEPILFDTALEAAAVAIEQAGVDLAGCEATLLRDLRGRLRLHIKKNPAGQAWPKDAKNDLKKALHSVEPFGTDVVYLEADGGHSKDFPLADVLKAERVRADLGGSSPRATWYRLERRFSKQAWLEVQGTAQEPWSLDENPAPVLSFYGFKGGVGRTTALAAFALYAAETLNKSVVVVDLDLESPGIGSLLTGAGVPLDLGVVDFLIEQQIRRTTPLPIERFWVDSPYVSGVGSIRVVPAGQLDLHYLEKLGRVDVQGLVEPGQAIREPLLALLKLLRDRAKPDVLLLDVRAGFHDLGGVSLSGLSHLELIFAAHAPQTWAGLSIVLNHLGYLRGDWVKLVHTMVPPNTRGGDDLHKSFVAKAYEVCSEHYYRKDAIPGPEDQEATHSAYRLTFREALLALGDLGVAKSELLADEHRLFCAQLAEDIGLSQ
jgi:cellulose biosynthesis protein BcsQ